LATTARAHLQCVAAKVHPPRAWKMWKPPTVSDFFVSPQS